jgi:tetratricopeptide (TPR) repeat protein
MSEQKIQQLLALAVKSIKSGDKDKGRQAFLAVLKLDPSNETGWMGLVSVASDNRERLTALKKVLTLNPNNARALAVLDKLGIPPERLIGETTPDEPPPEVEPVADDADPFDEPQFDAFVEPEPYTEPSPEPALFTDEIRESEQSSALMPDSEPEPMSAFDEPESEFELTRSVFESPPPMMGTQEGTPIANPQALSNVAQDVDNLVNEFLASEYKFENTTWIRKTKRRAGEADIWKWRAQILGVLSLIFIVFIGLPAGIFISTPEGQKVLYAPTHTQTATFTFTPSHTPGITPTSSAIPDATYTPTPTFFLQGSEGVFNTVVPPTLTTVYSPGGLFVGSRILEAWDLIRTENYREAFEILEDEKLAYESGYPYPYYLQAQIDLLGNNDLEAARKKVEAGEAQLENLASDRAINFVPMYHLAHGEVLMYEALQAKEAGQTGDANSLFSEAEDRFLTAVDLDGRITTAYVNIARIKVEQEEYQEAINILNIPIEGELSNEFFTDILLRVERGRVYFTQGIYDRALQEANEALFFEPWSEEAYILQAESALAMNNPGDANNLLNGFQLVYPESLLAFKLEGDAYRLEGKADQALLAYNIALQGNEDNPDYLIVLEARGDLYMEQRRFKLAEESYTEYLDVQKSDVVRSKRMLAAYNNGDYEVALDDARDLEGTRVVSNGDLALLQGQILVDTAETTADYNDALQQLSEAVITFGVSEESRAIAEEYLAQANFALGNNEQALLNIDRALIAGETGSRHYLKGQILEAQENYEAARDEYEFIIAWGKIFPYPFLEASEERYAEMVDLIENPPEEET